MSSRPIRSPEALPLELHLLNEHEGQYAEDLMQLEDLGLEMRHALLHVDGAEHK